MQLSNLKVLGVLMATAGFAALSARADSLQISATDSAGTHTSLIALNTPCGVDCTEAELTFSDKDFTFAVTLAMSNGPDGPALLNIQAISLLSLKGTVATPNNLGIEVTDVGFLLPVGATTLSQTLTTDTPGVGAIAKGSVTAQGFYNGDNTAFDTTGASTPKSSESSLAPGAGPTTSSLITFTTPFELTDEINISLTSKGSADLNATLSSVAAVPEPASMALMGTVLLLTAGVLRRRDRRA